jgi:hypothetical protein
VATCSTAPRPPPDRSFARPRGFDTASTVWPETAEFVSRDFYLKNPTPNGSRPSDLIGLHRKWQPRKKRPQPATSSSREEGGGDRGSTTARPTLSRDWGGPQVRDPVPIVSVNPEADPPQPRAPVRPNRAEQDGETAEEKREGIGIAAERGGEMIYSRGKPSTCV